MGVSTTHRINLSMWILIYSFSDTYYVWAACANINERSAGKAEGDGSYALPSVTRGVNTRTLYHTTF